MNDDLQFVKVRTIVAGGQLTSESLPAVIEDMTDGLPRLVRWNAGKAIKLTLTVEVADA